VLKSLKRAESLLDQLEQFLRCTHNNRYLMDVLLLQAEIHIARGDKELATAALGEAMALARSRGFIRFTVDMSSDVLHLLNQLDVSRSGVKHIGQILATYEKPCDASTENLAAVDTALNRSDSLTLLTRREEEVLHLLARDQGNQEIASTLGIALKTVKRHTDRIYHKLNVHSRQAACAKATGLGILRQD